MEEFHYCRFAFFRNYFEEITFKTFGSSLLTRYNLSLTIVFFSGTKCFKSTDDMKSNQKKVHNFCNLLFMSFSAPNALSPLMIDIKNIQKGELMPISRCIKEAVSKWARNMDYQPNIRCEFSNQSKAFAFC